MITLSETAKEAIKTALAMVIVYFIGLRMAWMNPYWAAIAVMVVSLPTTGQSLNKGAERLLGTIPGVLLALFFLGLFPQDRWLFILSVSLYLGFATYMMTGTMHSYFWKMTILVCLIVAEAGPSSSAAAFEKAWARTVETGTGAVVYTLVAVFLWPRTNLGTLKTVITKLFTTQAQLYRAGWKKMLGDGDAEAGEQELPELHKQEVELLGQFSAGLEAAGSESYAVHSQRKVWARIRELTSDLMTAFDALQAMLVDVARVDISRALPDLKAFGAEIDWRFDQIQRLPEGGSPDRKPRPVELSPSQEVIRGLSEFDRAAVAVARRQLLKVESLTRKMFEAVRALVESERSMDEDPRGATPAKMGWLPPTVDPDRVRAAIMVMASMWVSFLVVVYFNTPNGMGLVQLGPTLAFLVALTPQLKFSKLIPLLGIAFPSGLMIYSFILPHLSGFAELAVLIFTYMLLVSYFFKGLYRTLGIISFIIMVSIQNEQSYNFAAQANTLVYLLLGVLLVLACSHITVSTRPEKKFLQLLSRFFNSCEHLMPRWSDHPARGRGLVHRWQSAYYRRELTSLPQKLGAWGKFVDHKKFPGSSPEQVQQLVTSVQSLAYGMVELTEVGQFPQAEMLVRELLDDVRSWRESIEGTFRRWSTSPEADPAPDVQQRLDEELARLESRFTEVLDHAGQGELKDPDYENLYTLLGSYRGLSQAAVAYAGVARSVDLMQWREERF